MSIKIFVNTDKIYSEDINNRLSSVVLRSQSIDASVAVGDLVYYDSGINQWIVSANLTPQGMYVGVNNVMSSGLVSNLTGLVAGNSYWMNSSGKITDNPANAFNGTRIGRAMSSTELILDIDTVGNHTSIAKAAPTESGLWAGLKAYYKFDETSGRVGYDAKRGLIGNIYFDHPTYNYWVAGKINNGAYNGGMFAGTSGNKVGITGNSPRTISLWVKVNSFFSTDGLVEWGDRTTNNECELGINTTGRFRYSIFGTSINSTTGHATGTWHHVAVTFDGTTARLYINGSQNVTGTFSSTNTVDTVLTTHAIKKGTGTTDCTIDELAIFNRALSAAEITSLHNSNSGLSFTGISSNYSKYNYNETLSESKFNNKFENVLLCDEIHNGTNITGTTKREHDNMLVFPEFNNTWSVAESATPVGLYLGSGQVLLKGICSIGLEAGYFYYMDESGKPTRIVGNAYAGVKIGYALTNELFLLDIDIVDENLPVNPGLNDFIFVTTVADRQFAGLRENIDYEISGNTLLLKTMFPYNFKNFTLGTGTTLKLMTPDYNWETYLNPTLGIECSETCTIDGTINTKEQLVSGNRSSTVSSYSFMDRTFFRRYGGTGGVSTRYNWNSFMGHGHGGDSSDGAKGQPGNGWIGQVKDNFGVTGIGREVRWRYTCSGCSISNGCICFIGSIDWPGGDAPWDNSTAAGGGGGAYINMYSEHNMRDVISVGGETSRQYNANGYNGSIYYSAMNWNDFSFSAVAIADASGGNGGKNGSPGANVFIKAKNIIISGTIDASGQNGGNGGNGGRKAEATLLEHFENYGRFKGLGGYGGSGGGGGSSGDIILSYITTYTNTGTILTNKGTGGIGGSRPSDTTSSQYSPTPSSWQSKEGDGNNGQDGSLILIHNT